MIHYQVVIKGFAVYLENEFVPKLNGVMRWLAGGAISLALERADKTYKAVLSDKTVTGTLKMLAVLSDDEQQIDVDVLYKVLLPQAEKQAVTLDSQLFGRITFTKDDLTKLYECIKEAAHA